MDVLTNQNRDKGIVVWYLGPMFSGKTTELLLQYWRSKYGGQNSILFNHAIDIRYATNKVASHSKMMEDAIPITYSSELIQVYDQRSLENHVQNVFVDEAHFLDSGLIEVTKKITSVGTNVYLAALNFASSGKSFPFSDKIGAVKDLMDVVDYPKSFTAACYTCGHIATRTQKLVETGETVNVGGSEIYAPACVDHWIPRE